MVAEAEPVEVTAVVGPMAVRSAALPVYEIIQETEPPWSATMSQVPVMELPLHESKEKRRNRSNVCHTLGSELRVSEEMYLRANVRRVGIGSGTGGIGARRADIVVAGTCEQSPVCQPAVRWRGVNRSKQREIARGHDAFR